MRALLVLGALLMCIAYLSGTFSLRQPQQVALDMGFSGLRFLGLLLVLFWLQETFAKDIDRRTVTFALAYPAPRSAYVLGRFLGVMALIIATVLFWGALLAIVGQMSGGLTGNAEPVNYGVGYGVVLIGIALDLLVIGSFFVLVSSLAETPMLPFLISFGFALSGRTIGVMIDYLALSKQADAALRERLLPLLESLRWLIPDLSRLDWRQIVLYDNWPSWTYILQGVAVAVGYSVIMLGGAVLAYRRRSFT